MVAGADEPAGPFGASLPAPCSSGGAADFSAPAGALSLPHPAKSAISSTNAVIVGFMGLLLLTTIRPSARVLNKRFGYIGRLMTPRPHPLENQLQSELDLSRRSSRRCNQSR